MSIKWTIFCLPFSKPLMKWSEMHVITSATCDRSVSLILRADYANKTLCAASRMFCQVSWIASLFRGNLTLIAYLAGTAPGRQVPDSQMCVSEAYFCFCTISQVMQTAFTCSLIACRELFWHRFCLAKWEGHDFVITPLACLTAENSHFMFVSPLCHNYTYREAFSEAQHTSVSLNTSCSVPPYASASRLF